MCQDAGPQPVYVSASGGGVEHTITGGQAVLCLPPPLELPLTIDTREVTGSPTPATRQANLLITSVGLFWGNKYQSANIWSSADAPSLPPTSPLGEEQVSGYGITNDTSMPQPPTFFFDYSTVDPGVIWAPGKTPIPGCWTASIRYEALQKEENCTALIQQWRDKGYDVEFVSRRCEEQASWGGCRTEVVRYIARRTTTKCMEWAEVVTSPSPVNLPFDVSSSVPCEGKALGGCGFAGAVTRAMLVRGYGGEIAAGSVTSPLQDPRVFGGVLKECWYAGEGFEPLFACDDIPFLPDFEEECRKECKEMCKESCEEEGKPLQSCTCYQNCMDPNNSDSPPNCMYRSNREAYILSAFACGRTREIEFTPDGDIVVPANPEFPGCGERMRQADQNLPWRICSPNEDTVFSASQNYMDDVLEGRSSSSTPTVDDISREISGVDASAFSVSCTYPWWDTWWRIKELAQASGMSLPITEITIYIPEACSSCNFEGDDDTDATVCTGCVPCGWGSTCPDERKANLSECLSAPWKCYRDPAGNLCLVDWSSNDAQANCELREVKFSGYPHDPHMEQKWWRRGKWGVNKERIMAAMSMPMVRVRGKYKTTGLRKESEIRQEIIAKSQGIVELTEALGVVGRVANFLWQGSSELVAKLVSKDSTPEIRKGILTSLVVMLDTYAALYVIPTIVQCMKGVAEAAEGLGGGLAGVAAGLIKSLLEDTVSCPLVSCKCGYPPPADPLKSLGALQTIYNLLRKVLSFLPNKALSLSEGYKRGCPLIPIPGGCDILSGAVIAGLTGYAIYSVFKNTRLLFGLLLLHPIFAFYASYPELYEMGISPFDLRTVQNALLALAFWGETSKLNSNVVAGQCIGPVYESHRHPTPTKCNLLKVRTFADSLTKDVGYDEFIHIQLCAGPLEGDIYHIPKIRSFYCCFSSPFERILAEHVEEMRRFSCCMSKGKGLEFCAKYATRTKFACETPEWNIGCGPNCNDIKDLRGDKLKELCGGVPVSQLGPALSDPPRAVRCGDPVCQSKWGADKCKSICIRPLAERLEEYFSLWEILLAENLRGKFVGPQRKEVISALAEEEFQNTISAFTTFFGNTNYGGIISNSNGN